MKIINFINLGGPVNWGLVLLLVWSLVLIIERIIFYIETSSKGKKSYINRMQTLLSASDKLEASEEKKLKEKEISLIYFEANRGLWVINFISAVAPSLGLLGTVTGLIKAFQSISQLGSQINMQDLSHGIWEAMLTTAFGMVISIPTLFFYRSFRRIIEKRMARLNLLFGSDL